MWFRGVAASVGLCFDFGAVLEGHPDVVLSVNGDVVHHRQSTRLLTELSQERSNRGIQKMSLSTVCWWRRGSTPRPRGLCSLRADLAIRSRIAPSFVLSPKSGAFRRPLFPNFLLCPAYPKVLWRRSVKIGDTRITMPTLDSEYFLYKELYEIKTCCMASLFSLLKNLLFWIPYGKKEQMDIL